MNKCYWEHAPRWSFPVQLARQVDRFTNRIPAPLLSVSTTPRDIPMLHCLCIIAALLWWEASDDL